MDNNASDEPVDIKVRSMDQHEDSVYAVAWYALVTIMMSWIIFIEYVIARSVADAWVYVSLSFDGRLEYIYIRIYIYIHGFRMCPI